MKPTPAMLEAKARLMAKVEQLKDQPGPKILQVSFKKTTGEPYLKMYGARTIEEFHKKFDPELREFIDVCRATMPSQ